MGPRACNRLPRPPSPPCLRCALAPEMLHTHCAIRAPTTPIPCIPGRDTHTNTHTHRHTRRCNHTSTHAETQPQTQTQTHKDTHTHPQTRIFIYICIYTVLVLALCCRPSYPVRIQTINLFKLFALNHPGKPTATTKHDW